MNFDYREIIKEVYEIRRARNSSYSLRAFARDLGITPTRISDILNHRQGLSLQVAEQVSERMNLNENTRQLFLALVEAAHGRSRTSRAVAQKRVNKYQGPNQTEQKIALETFKVVSDWQHFAILELIRSKAGILTPELANRLELTRAEVEDSLQRLVRVKLINRKKEGYICSDELVTADSQTASLAVQKYHSQILRKAQESLEKQGVDTRDFSAINMMVSLEQIPELKAKIKEFRRNLLKWVEKTPERNRIYNLSIQLFSLEK